MFGENRRFVFFYLIMVLAVVFAGVMALSLGPANAQTAPICAPFEALRTTLQEKYHETQTGMGLINDQTLVTLFESADGESWTLVALGADGKACVVFDGTYWSRHEPPAPPVPGERAS